MKTSHLIQPDNGCDVCQLWLASPSNWNPETQNSPKKELKVHTIYSHVITGNSISDVYATCISDKEISHFVGCREECLDKVEEVRNDFLEFLREKEKDGIIYQNQVWAWNAYKEWQILFSTPDVDHLDTDDDEVLDESWTEEMERKAYEKANTLEFLGNYDYSRKANALPAQQ